MIRSRLVAQRANAIGYETGVFTPTFTFAVPGDLSVVYNNQDGDYWRLADRVHFVARLDCTPTFTTSVGNFRMAGLPFASNANEPHSDFAVHFSEPGSTWPAGVTQVLGTIQPGQQHMIINGQGSAIANAQFGPGQFTSGASMLLRATGVYRI